MRHPSPLTLAPAPTLALALAFALAHSSPAVAAQQPEQQPEQHRILWGAPGNTNLSADASPGLESFWYNWPSDLNAYRAYKNSTRVSDVYASGKGIQLIVWLADAGRVDATGATVPKTDPAYDTATPYFISEKFQSDIRELAGIFRGQGPHYGPLYIVLYSEIETYYDAGTAEGRARRDALKAGYIRAANTIRSANASAHVGLGLGGYAWPATAGGTRADLDYWREAIAASDFTCFQNMQKYDHWQECAGQTRNAIRQLGEYGMPVMVSHFELWPSGTHTMDEQIVTTKLAFNAYMDDIFADDSFATLHAQGLRAWVFKTPADYNGKPGGNYLKKYDQSYTFTFTSATHPELNDNTNYAQLRAVASSTNALWTGSAAWLFDPSTGEDDTVYARLRDFVIARASPDPQIIPADARALAAWRFTNLAANTALPAAPTVSNAGITVSGLTNGAGVSFTVTTDAGNPAPALQDDGNATGVNRDTETAAITNNEYLSFTVTPAAGRTLALGALGFDIRARAKGIGAQYTETCHAALYTSLAGFSGTAARIGPVATASVTGAGAGADVSSQWIHTEIPLAALAPAAGQPVEFRLYVWRNTTAQAGFDARLMECDNIVLTGFALNNPPSIAPVENQTIAADTTLGPLAITLSDDETPPASLTLTATSSNQNLIPDDAITPGGSGSARTLTLTPAAGRGGIATITLTVSDGEKTTATSFTVTVTKTGAPLALAAWQFDNIPDGTSLPIAPATVADADAGDITASALANGPGVSFIVKSGVIQDDGDSAGVNRASETSALANNEYLTFTITPPADRAPDLTTLDFELRTHLAGVGAQYTETYHAALYSDIAGFSGTTARIGGITSATATGGGAGSDVSSDWIHASIPAGALQLTPGQPVEFRLYLWRTTTAQAGFNVRLVECRDITLHGYPAAPPPAPGVAPQITSPADSIFSNGLDCHFTLAASGTPPPVITVAGLPSWAAFDPVTGIISGAPPAGDDAQNYTVIITASNGAGANAVQTFTLRAQPAPTATGSATIITLGGGFQSPVSIAPAPDGFLFIADAASPSLLKLTAGNRVVPLRHTGTFSTPAALALDPARNTLYVTDAADGTLHKIALATGETTLLATSIAPPLALDSAGNLYTADAATLALCKIAPDSTTPVPIAQLDTLPAALAINAAATRLYAADSANNTIYSIDTHTGALSPLAGCAGAKGASDGAGETARFNHPAALAWQPDGTLLVLDTGNHTLRRIDLSTRAVTTIAGAPGTPGNTDGTSATVQFDSPAALARDSADNAIYIADTGNRVIRMLVTPPAITTAPRAQTAAAGSTVTFTAAASGAPAPDLQWHFNDTPIASATTSTLTLQNVQNVNAGSYTILATNPAATASATATLTITATTSDTGNNNNNTNNSSGAGGGGGSGGGGTPGAVYYIALIIFMTLRRFVRRTTNH
jgi:sugar lactone lactonase YvrE